MSVVFVRLLRLSYLLLETLLWVALPNVTFDGACVARTYHSGSTTNPLKQRLVKKHRPPKSGLQGLISSRE